MNARATLVATVLVAVVVAAGVGPVAAVPAAAGSTGEVPAAAGSAGQSSAPTAPVAGDATPDGQEEQDCEYPLELTDASGETVTIEEEPETVVTMAPSAAQTMVEIGAWDEVVAVSQFALYLDGADERENISAPGFGNYEIERMVELDPDVVLAPNVISNQTVNQVRQAGLTVVRFEAATSIEDVTEKTRLTGRIVGACEGAEESVRWMEDNLDAVSAAVEDRDRPKAVYVTGTFTTGGGTFVNDMITTSGATNIMAEAGLTGFKPVDEEVVATENPSWVVTTNPQSDVLEQSPYDSTRAAEEGNLLYVSPNWINQPAPRSVVYAVRNMTEAFHPEAYGEGDYVSREEAARTPTPTATPTATPTDTPSTTDTPTATPSPTPTETRTSPDAATTAGTTEDGGGGGIPGFTGPAALLAILASLAVLARRRR